MKSAVPSSSPGKGEVPVNDMASEWTTYRTRFLIKARRLEQPVSFVDCLGRQHSGKEGDYLVLSSEGSQRVAPREIFEDIYVPMNEAPSDWPSGSQTSRSQLELLQLETRDLQSKLSRSRTVEHDPVTACGPTS